MSWSNPQRITQPMRKKRVCSVPSSDMCSGLIYLGKMGDKICETKDMDSIAFDNDFAAKAMSTLFHFEYTVKASGAVHVLPRANVYRMFSVIDVVFCYVF